MRMQEKFGFETEDKRAKQELPSRKKGNVTESRKNIFTAKTRKISMSDLTVRIAKSGMTCSMRVHPEMPDESRKGFPVAIKPQNLNQSHSPNKELLAYKFRSWSLPFYGRELLSVGGNVQKVVFE
ncbi:hypothetical protein ACFE04_019743 [Oxalis oulophora]